MCMFCGGNCGGAGNLLIPFIGIGGAMIISKIENKLRKLKKSIKRKRIISGLILISFISIIILFGCSSDNNRKYESKKENEKIQIVTTLFPLYEFSRAVGSEKVEVYLLLPPGVDPHTFEPRPGDIAKIKNSDIFVYVGAGMEPWADDLLNGIGNENLITLDSSSKVRLIKSDSRHEEHYEEDEVSEEKHLEQHEKDRHHGEYDPHFWLSFENDIKLIDAIAEMLSEKDKSNKEYYLANANEYKKRLYELDKKYKNGLANCKKRMFVTGGHNAYSYLAREYNLTYLSAYSISPNSEPTPKKIKEIVDIVKKEQIGYIMFEEMINPKLSEVIAQESGARTIVLNPGHIIPKSDFEKRVSFIDIMNNNLDILRKVLECD